LASLSRSCSPAAFRPLPGSTSAEPCRTIVPSQRPTPVWPWRTRKAMRVGGCPAHRFGFQCQPLRPERPDPDCAEPQDRHGRSGAHAPARSAWQRQHGVQPGGTALAARFRKVHLSCRPWRMKEALINAVGGGLSPNPSRFEVPETILEGDRSSAFRFSHLPSSCWHVIDPGERRFAGALACRAADCGLWAARGFATEPAPVDPRMAPDQNRIVRNRALH